MLHLKYVSAKSKQSRCPIYILKQKEILTFSFPGAALSSFLFFKYFFASPSVAHPVNSITRALGGGSLSRKGRTCPEEGRLPASPPAPPSLRSGPLRLRPACWSSSKTRREVLASKQAWWDPCDTGSTRHWCSTLLACRTVGFAL